MTTALRVFIQDLSEALFWKKPRPLKLVLMGRALWGEAVELVRACDERNDRPTLADQQGRMLFMAVPASPCDLLEPMDYAFVTAAAVTVTPEKKAAVTEEDV